MHYKVVKTPEPKIKGFFDDSNLQIWTAKVMWIFSSPTYHFKIVLHLSRPKVPFIYIFQKTVSQKLRCLKMECFLLWVANMCGLAQGGLHPFIFWQVQLFSHSYSPRHKAPCPVIRPSAFTHRSIVSQKYIRKRSGWSNGVQLILCQTLFHK